MNAGLPPQAYAAALAALPLMSLPRLASLLRHHAPHEAFAVAAGEHPPSGLIERVLLSGEVRAAWAHAASSESVERMWQRCVDLDLTVLVIGLDGYPAVLRQELAPPPVLFAAGAVELLDGRRVAVVGTRNATAAGRDIATRLGRDLSGAGVHVVSGLARGIDACAHRGALSGQADGRPIGVVASGHDVVYPKEHRELWRSVWERGLLLSESPPGRSPEPFRFPQRNRIIAALSEVVVVVESREQGGSLITAEEALARNIPVMAVPGGVHNRAAAGANRLLRDGAGVVVDAGDVLTVLDIDHQRSAFTVSELRPRPVGVDLQVYRSCCSEPRTIDGLALACSLSLVDTAMAVARLEQTGWIEASDGWFEATGSPL